MISVCICTHNAVPAILPRCIAALRGLRLPPVPVELVVVDNRCDEPLSASTLGLDGFPFPARVIREETLGLTSARIRAGAEAWGDVLVFVDDDNLLAPDYLLEVHRCLALRPGAGAIGGRIAPLSEVPLPDWFDEEFLSYLACIDRGDEALRMLHEKTPYGAGLAVRTKAFRKVAAQTLVLGDRKGSELRSGGDTELCYRLRVEGWEVWYEPTLRLQHWLPARRLTVGYLESLSHGFGLDRPRIELFWFRGTWKRRIAYLRRSLKDSREARRAAAAIAPGGETNENVRRRLRARFLEGQARSLRELAFGPPIWRGVPIVDPER